MAGRTLLIDPQEWDDDADPSLLDRRNKRLVRETDEAQIANTPGGIDYPPPDETMAGDPSTGGGGTLAGLARGMLAKTLPIALPSQGGPKWSFTPGPAAQTAPSRPSNLAKPMNFAPMDVEGRMPSAMPSDSASSPAGAVMKTAMGAALPDRAALASKLGAKFGASPAPDDSGYNRAYLASALGRTFASLGNGMDTFTNSLLTRGGTRKSSMLQGGDAAANMEAANAPLQAYEAKRQSDLRDQQSQRTGLQSQLERQKMAREMDYDDPSSESSRALQDAVIKSLPHADPTAIRGMPASMLQKQFGEMIKAQGVTDKRDMRENPTALDQAKLDATRARTEAMKSSQGVQYARLGQGERRLDLQGQKFGLQRHQLEVPGYEGLAPTSKEAGSAREYQGNLATLDQNIAQLSDLSRRYGGQVLPTEAKAEMQRAAARLVPLMSKLEETGALTNGHASFLQHQLGDPNSFEAFVNNGAFQKRLQEIREDAHAHYQHKMGGLGMQQTSAHPNGSVKMVGPNGESGAIDASEVDEARRNGWKVAQ